MGSFPRLRGKAGMGNTIVGHWCWREDCPQPVRSGAVYGHSDGPRDNAVQMENEQARPAAAAGRGARRLQCGALSCNAPAVSFPGYDFTSHHLEVRPGIRMHYLDEGPRDGEVVVMLHGNPSWSYYWRHLVHGLRDRWRCIVPDHIGMGLSDKPDDRPIATPRYDYTLRSRVDDLSTLLEGIGITGPVTLAVHDWGGLIGFSWALGHPSRVKRLVILNTAAFPMPAAKTMPWQLSLGRDYFLGEVLIRGAHVAAGYWKQPELSAQVFRGGWFHTGDLGVLDESGILRITGRLKEVIRTGGKSVLPDEVERALCSHPAVADAAAAGLPDPEWGEVIGAAVVLNEGARIEAETLVEHCRQSLSGFKKPRIIRFVTSIPRSHYGKIQRAKVRALLAETTTVAGLTQVLTALAAPAHKEEKEEDKPR